MRLVRKDMVLKVTSVVINVPIIFLTVRLAQLPTTALPAPITRQPQMDHVGLAQI